MAVEALKATQRGSSAAASHGLANSVKSLVATVEVSAAASATSTYEFFNIPSDARIRASLAPTGMTWPRPACRPWTSACSPWTAT